MMDLGKNLLQSVEESVSVVSQTQTQTQSHPNGKDSHTRNLAGELVSSITQTVSGSSGAQEVQAGGGALKSLASDGVQGNLNKVLACSASQLPISSIGDSISKQSISNPSSSVAGALGTLESSLANPVNQIGDVASSAMAGVAEDAERQVSALVLARLQSIVIAFASSLPFVGAYFKQHANDIDVNTLVSETTPLLGALRDPKAFAAQEADGLLRRMLSSLLCRLPDVDTLDNMQWVAYGPVFKALVEFYVLAMDGSGWLFTHLQEHSLVIAPTVSLGHLSTTDLAASTIGTAVASVTGYSIIQGFISSLDKLLATSPNHHVAKMHCARAAFVTGIVLFPITNLWAVHSVSILRLLGQAPEVAGPAGEYLRIASAGLPGYAVGEIAKRYLTSQGLSSVHTRLLSITAPVNMVLNYLLVDGPIPALRLGFAGAPLCTVLSHNALAAMLIIYIVQRAVREEVDYLRGRSPTDEEHVNNTTDPNPSASTAQVPDQLNEGFSADMDSLLYSGVSGVSKSASQLWSKDFGGLAASMLGPNALATQAVLLTTATTLYQAPKAINNASSDRIKKWINKGDVQRAKIVAFISFLGTIGGAFVISNILLASASSWGRLFNNDPVIIENVSAALPIIAVFQAVHALGAWADSSLGALGKTAVFPALNASADGFLGIPLGLYLTFPKGWGLAGLWVGLTVSLAYSCLMATLVLVRSNWKNAVGERESASGAQEGIHVAAEPSGFTSLA